MASLLILVLLGCNLQVQKTGRGGDPGASPSPSIKCWCGESWEEEKQRSDRWLSRMCNRWGEDNCPKGAYQVSHALMYDDADCYVEEVECDECDERCAGECAYLASCTTTCDQPGESGGHLAQTYYTAGGSGLRTDCVEVPS